MKLFEVPPRTTVRLLEDAQVPPGAAPLVKGDVIRFHHIDGMYSYSHKDGNEYPVHPAAWTEVEII